MTPEEIIEFAEKVHATLDIDQMLQCFDPRCVVYWNGVRVAEGLEEIRRFYEATFGDVTEFSLKKTFRAATDNVIAVEWVHTMVKANGDVVDGAAAEIWTIENDRLVEWRAYCTETPRG